MAQEGSSPTKPQGDATSGLGTSVAQLGRGGDGRPLQAEEGFNVCPSVSVRYKPGVAGKGLGMARKTGKFPLKWTVGGINELSSSIAQQSEQLLLLCLSLLLKPGRTPGVSCPG